MKLYYSPGACSLAPHLALEEAGADYAVERLDFSKSQQRSPEYLAINPKGRVPALVGDGFTLTEAPAILAFVAQGHPEARLWPEDARRAARCAEWLAWCSSTVHIAYAHIRRPERYASSDGAKQEVVEKGKETCRQVWRDVDAKLGAGPWAVGETFSVADCYVLVFWTWGGGPALGFDMAADCPNWTAHARRMAQRPAVQRVFAQEGLTLPA